MKYKAALFDLDGTLLATEEEYTIFWADQCFKYLGRDDMKQLIKGSTLKQIFGRYFPDENIQKQIFADLCKLESSMKYDYIKGALDYVDKLKSNNINCAIVTSSNIVKMNYVFDAHPEMKTMFNPILMSEDFSQSKPNPECFLIAAQRLGLQPTECIVFEDSHYGLEAGRRAGMKVVGLATTLPKSEIANEADIVVSNFTELSLSVFE